MPTKITGHCKGPGATAAAIRHQEQQLAKSPIVFSGTPMRGTINNLVFFKKSNNQNNIARSFTYKHAHTPINAYPVRLEN